MVITQCALYYDDTKFLILTQKHSFHLTTQKATITKFFNLNHCNQKAVVYALRLV